MIAFILWAVGLFLGFVVLHEMEVPAGMAIAFFFLWTMLWIGVAT